MKQVHIVKDGEYICGVYANKADARGAQRRLKARGRAAYLITADVIEKVSTRGPVETREACTCGGRRKQKHTKDCARV